MHGSKIAILVLLVLSFGCLKNKIAEDQNIDFFRETSLRWIAATKISWVNENIKKDLRNNNRIMGVSGEWQPILRVSFIDFNSNEVSDCLYYKELRKEDLGEIKVIPNPQNNDCKDLLDEKPYASLFDVANFSFDITDNMDSKKHFELMIDTKKFDYIFGNFTNDRYGNELFSSSVKKSRGRGVLIHSEISYTASSSKHGSLADGVVCFDVNNKCQVTAKNNCSKCKNGWYEVLSNKCATNGRRICGDDNCGKKGKPACIRGHIASGINPKNFCFKGSPSGFCAPGLTTACINDILVCE